MSNIFLEKCGNSPIFEKLGWKVAVKEVNFCSFGVVLVRIHFLSFSAKFSTQEISSNFKKKSKNAEIGVRKTLFLEAWIWSNICRIWMKSGWWERLISVILDLFEAVLGRVQFPSFSANIRILEISSNFKKFSKILKLASEKLYFQRILYGRIFVGFTWKVDSEKGQILYFSTCFTVFS